MKDDIWLQELAQIKRDQEADERRRLDERWERLSGGGLSAEEEAELRALAATSEEAREAYEAFQPLGADFQARLVRNIRWRYFPLAAIKAWLAKLRSFRLPIPARWGAAAAPVAATVAFLLRPDVPLRNYASLNVAPAVYQMRGEQLETGEVKVFAPGDQIKLTLRPKTAPPLHIWPRDARCFLAGNDEVLLLDIGKESINKNGVATMQCALKDNQKPGRWTLLAVIGRWGMLPDSADLRFASTNGPIRDRDWVALPEKILIQPRGVAP